MKTEFKPGTITFVRGPMYAGKTTTAIRMAQDLEWSGHAVRYVRPKRSRREFEPAGMVASHNAKYQYPVREYDAIDEVEKVLDVENHVVDVVILGEAMLWEDQEGLFQLVCCLRIEGKMVIVESLTADSEGLPFGSGAVEVLAIADYIRTLRADCSNCGAVGAATQSWSLREKGQQVDVGGSGKYIAVCPPCWRDLWAERSCSGAMAQSTGRTTAQQG